MVGVARVLASLGTLVLCTVAFGCVAGVSGDESSGETAKQTGQVVQYGFSSNEVENIRRWWPTLANPPRLRISGKLVAPCVTKKGGFEGDVTCDTAAERISANKFCRAKINGSANSYIPLHGTVNRSVVVWNPIKNSWDEKKHFASWFIGIRCERGPTYVSNSEL